jgi:hypothetical protein
MPSQVNPRGFFRLGSAARRRWRPRAELRAVCTAHSPDPMRAVRTAHSGSTHCPFGTHVRPMRAARAARIAPTAAARKSAARVADLGETGQPMQQEIRDGRSVPYQTQARRPSKWPCARPVTYVRVRPLSTKRVPLPSQHNPRYWGPPIFFATSQGPRYRRIFAPSN